MDKEDISYIYNRILLSLKDEILPFVANGWVDCEGIMLRKISHMGKNKYDFIHVWDTKKPKQIKTKK